MSLSLRFNLGLTAIVLVIFGAAAGFVVLEARRAVDEEMQSAFDWTAALVRIITADAAENVAAVRDRIQRVTATQARHMRVTLLPRAQSIPLVPRREPAAPMKWRANARDTTPK
ncbi:MAG: hypothetical protein ACREXT_06580 [Gammaproteobacteria bacterium]